MGGTLSDLRLDIVESIPDALANVDLLRIAKERSQRESPLKSVVDGECCLDRLDGGYYPEELEAHRSREDSTCFFGYD